MAHLAPSECFLQPAQQINQKAQKQVQKHFQNMHKDVGMAMPKSIPTRCGWRYAKDVGMGLCMFNFLLYAILASLA